MNETGPIGAILLAAGASVRLGTAKQLVTRGEGGPTLLRHAASECLASRCGERVVVVLGAHAAQTGEQVEDMPLQVVHNETWAEGMGGSLRVGITSLLRHWPDTQAAVVFLCDQPYLTRHTLNGLVQAYEETGKTIAASEYGGALGAPCLFDRALFAELGRVSGNVGAKRLLALHSPDEIARVPFPGGEIDIDTPADYAHLLSASKATGESIQ